ncbi:MAG: hypothetical protein Ct9H300mP1_01690 [Planctomycetaceae bacterium]|nr:MAG: hypothetical protein Ct9H300mP1_01690 [Planctomycetaceae bacterium]
MVLFFSDNGANRNGRNGCYGVQGKCWEGVTGSRRSRGGRNDFSGAKDIDQAITFDVMPTLIELAGGRIPEGHRWMG